MTGLRTGVDPLEVDLLVRESLRLHNQRLSQGDETLLGSDYGSSQHDVVLVDETVAGESSLKIAYQLMSTSIRCNSKLEHVNKTPSATVVSIRN